MFEGPSIASGNIKRSLPNRPMTHDLFKSFASGFVNYEIERIVNYRNEQEGVYYAKTSLKKDLVLPRLMLVLLLMPCDSNQV